MEKMENEVWYQHECQSRPECRDRRSARGSGLAQVLIQTQVQSPRGWYCIYQYLSKPGSESIYLRIRPLLHCHTCSTSVYTRGGLGVRLIAGNRQVVTSCHISQP